MALEARSLAAGALLAGLVGCPWWEPPVAGIEAFDVATVDVGDEGAGVWRSLTLWLVAKRGCPQLAGDAYVTLNGSRGVVDPGPDAFTCRNPSIGFAVPPPSPTGTDAPDGVVEFHDGRTLVLRNLMVQRGWTQDGAFVDRIVASPGDTVVLVWSPDTDVIGNDPVLGPFPARFVVPSTVWPSTVYAFPPEDGTLTFVVPEVPLSGGWMEFAPPVQCDNIQNCSAISVRGFGDRVLTIASP